MKATTPTETTPRPVLDAEWISDRAARTPGRALWWGMNARLAVRLGLVVLALGLVAAGWWWLRPATAPVRVPHGVLELVDAPALGHPPPSGAPAQGAPGPADEGPGPDTAEVLLHLAGAVAEPGLVSVPAGARVGDALGAAGGPAPDADLDAVNLAAPVVDGEQIYVPTRDEHAPPAQAGAAGAGGGAAGGGLVNLNTATAAELETLPGIGPVTAEAIVADRSANGPFAAVGDLQRISGIGPALVSKLEGKATP